MSQQISFSVQLVPAFDTNYIFLLRVAERLAVIDPGAADPVLQELQGQKLHEIWITHHHSDHQGGVEKLLLLYPECKVRGPQNDPRMPLTFEKNLKSDFDFSGISVNVIDAPGHTKSHIIYSLPALKIAFVGDVVFGLGCGRVFEGSYEDMFRSIQKIKTLSADTKLYCAHEYTLANANFIQRKLPLWNLQPYLNQAQSSREKNYPTVPLSLSDEMIFNPFLVAKDVAEFSHYRDLKNKF